MTDTQGRAIQADGRHAARAKRPLIEDPRALESVAIARQPARHHHFRGQDAVQPADEFAAIHEEAVREDEHRTQIVAL
jgi:hypothetical protein